MIDFLARKICWFVYIVMGVDTSAKDEHHQHTFTVTAMTRLCGSVSDGVLDVIGTCYRSVIQNALLES